MIIVIGLGALVGFAFGSVAVGAIVGSLIGWVLWAFLVPLWRDWVPGTTAPRAEVQKLAQRTGLVWREGFLLD
ncbi:MAG TPA: hypothetical protein VLI04_12405, partial [Nocardioidaceae bacterium]|nr:hypothetical protein [Nocardioidaceae bacterium]